MLKLTVAFRNFVQVPKNQSVNALYWNNRCSFRDPKQSQKYTLLGELDLFNFKMAVHKVGLITWPQKVNVLLKYFACDCQIFCVPVFYTFSRDICIKSLIIAISMHNDSSVQYIFTRAQWNCFFAINDRTSPSAALYSWCGLKSWPRKWSILSQIILMFLGLSRKIARHYLKLLTHFVNRP